MWERSKVSGESLAAFPPAPLFMFFFVGGGGLSVIISIISIVGANGL